MQARHMAEVKPGAARPEREQSARARQIVEAAYGLIAEKGFEGLRTRDVSTRIGINSATLHYYFADKETLIRGVVDYLIEELRQSRVPVVESQTAGERLHAEFEDIRSRLRDSPKQLIVLTELAVRSLRDPAIAALLLRMDEGWRWHLTGLFSRGVASGEFRAGLDVHSAATSLMLQLRGLGYHVHLGHGALSALVDTIEDSVVRAVRAGP